MQHAANFNLLPDGPISEQYDRQQVGKDRNQRAG
jgi:hypothetical protein